MASVLRRQVLASLRPYRTQFAIAVGQVVLITGAELLKPWPFKIIIDHVLHGNPLAWGFVTGWSRDALLLAACLSMVAIYLFLGGLNVINNYTTIRIGHMGDHTATELEQLLAELEEVLTQ